MIIVKLMGGLGNQMFQYALGRNLALKNKVELRLDISWFSKQRDDGATNRTYRLGSFMIEENFTTEEESARLMKTSWRDYFQAKERRSWVRQEKIKFEPWILKVKDNVYLEGYWQSEKYFQDNQEIIRKDFELKNEWSTAGKEWLEQINSCQAVSVHIRRGDYANDQKTKNYHGECAKEYYERAGQEAIRGFTNPVFFVFSDDLPWAQENIKLPGKIRWVTGTKNQPAEEIRLQSACQHNIIANSTFGWWGAWLNKNPHKKVWAPRNWFADAEAESQASDIVPHNWLKI
ncbi:MAG TPA: alpha-1,2-fucosyltransferase [bacterium]|nr:alpha-1,2-fucosyltransferase [bacterium]